MNRFRREMLGFIFQDFNLLDTLTDPLKISHWRCRFKKVKPEEIDRESRNCAPYESGTDFE